MRTNEEAWTINTSIAAVLAVLTLTTGCGQEKPHGAGEADNEHGTPPAAESRDLHGEDDGHGHAPATTGIMSIDDRVTAKCEHDTPMYQCDECRYEAGVVKVDTSLLKRTDGGGLVRTHTVAMTKASAALPMTGEIALNENASVHVSPRVDGLIETVAVDVGARVNAGDLLLALTSVEVGKSLAEYERNRTLTELSEKVFARESRLHEQKVGSEQDMIDAQMTFEQHRTELKASEQTLHVFGLTEQDLSSTNQPLHGPAAGRLPVRAPIAGTIIEKHAVPGEMVEPGKDLMLLSDLSTVWVWANVQSRDLAALLAAERQGPVPVEVTVSAFPERPFQGMLDYVGSTMNEQTRTVKVRATVANPDLALRPGMFCEVSVAIGNGQAEEVLAAPRAAVMSDEGKSFVFKHWKDDFFVRQDVRKGREFFGMVEILEGLRVGDTVAAEGAFLLKSDVLREKMGAGCAD